MQPDRLALVSVAAVLMLTCVGVGYGLDYTATTLNSNNTLDAKYMEFKLNDQATCTFEFGNIAGSSDLTYYRDRAADGTVTYKYNYVSSEKMKVQLVGTGVSGGTTAYVKLADELTGTSLSLQFYTNQACTETSKYGSAIVLSDQDQQISGGLTINTAYWCILTATVETATLAMTPSGTIGFDVVFYATAEAETV